MEDASKAILIAGAILIILGVISIAVVLLYRSGNIIDETGDIAINSAKRTNQINKFAKYDGNVTGIQVKECVSAALSHNSNLTNGTYEENLPYAVTVIARGQTYVDRTTYNIHGGRNDAIMDDISTNIGNNERYICTLTYNDTFGTIRQIEFVLH